ncbi:Cathepsin D precursor, putative [Perkinsus marinus ATCC 50983]|uniref:Cathepsin D, putative n=1 Tax=Perkinsus marinus (strain ATCC 50983 / TXsc) TaxID=423536 RepID=C5LUM3_PERM5|nr:Cathepsin D precursor, putative [Perkinsus marinus ATCC 50983]EEQ99569.1 Cathepsin D precursor, putative [Perkinsus marinus ATCC 50983]|eukprot:XP_002766852.1 Cathepsin D precursor, putative [Perkinsus marinus ATCC 50983]
MTQLRSSKTVTTQIIALYLYPPADLKEASADGGLLLGGGDPALYEGALKYVVFSSAEEYRVNLRKLYVGVGPIYSLFNMNLDLDTGANALFVPKLYYMNLIKDIHAETVKAAGTDVVFEYDSKEMLWSFPCQHMSKLPQLKFDLGPEGMTPFTMTYTNYARYQYGICLLTIALAPGNDWTFHDRMLIGNYFEFDPSLNRVGIGKLKPRSL